MSLQVIVVALLAQTEPPLVQGGSFRSQDGLTEMNFLALKGEEAFRVTAGDDSCDTPCVLRMRPGPAKVHVLGPGERDLQLVVPHLAAQVRLHTGPPDWYQTAGAILIPTGIVIGASMWALMFACGFGPNSGPCYALNATAWPVLGAAMIVTGSVLLGLYNKTPPPDANRVEILDAAISPPVKLQRLALGFLRDGFALRF